MKIKGVSWAATVLLVLTVSIMFLTGCADIKNKFIRKPKEEEKPSRYLAVKKYDVHPSMELYTKRYIFWKNWHRELLAVLDHSNHKKKVVAVEQDVSNLLDMQRMLTDEKAEQMQGVIDQMIGIEADIKKERVTHGNEVRLRRRIENAGKEIKRDYSYNKVQGYIRDDFKPRAEYTTN